MGTKKQVHKLICYNIKIDLGYFMFPNLHEEANNNIQNQAKKIKRNWNQP